MTPSTDLVPLPQVREAVLSGYVPEFVDPEALAMEFAERLMRADTPEALFSIVEAVKASDIFGEPFVLNDAQFLRSDFEEGGLSVYALLRCHNESRGDFAVTCGGRNVVVQCLRAREEGWLPRLVTLTEAGQQKVGRDRPLYLVMSTQPQAAPAKAK